VFRVLSVVLDGKKVSHALDEPQPYCGCLVRSEHGQYKARIGLRLDMDHKTLEYFDAEGHSLGVAFANIDGSVRPAMVRFASFSAGGGGFQMFGSCCEADRRGGEPSADVIASDTFVLLLTPVHSIPV
jgi:hypothetical protein